MESGVMQSILGEYSDRIFIDLDPPSVTMDTILKCREYCEKDECGCYDKYCSCPPRCGTPQERLGVLSKYSKAAVVPLVYNIDYRDAKALKQATKDLQDTCRNMVLRLKDKGLDCIGFADGGCMYCPRCSALDDEPCRYPEMQIQSVSGNGIVMSEFLKRCGIDMSFTENRLEMYAVIIYN